MRIIKSYLVALAAVVILADATPSFADVNDFTFSSFDAHYSLSVNKSQDNRPEMNVTETLVANFPNTDQNHGIRRSIPSSSYSKYPGLITDISVFDEIGKPRDFEVSSDSDFINLLIKPADGSFVHGKQTYVIKYHQSWVINNYQGSTGNDEFYWDVNGTGWLQSFDKVSATVELDKTLATNVLQDKMACYQGLQGSKESCLSLSVDGNQLHFSSRKLQAGENLTIAVAFNPNVANTKGPDVSGTLYWYLFWICLILVVLIVFWAVYFRFVKIKSAEKSSFIVPQYKPATEPGLLVSALVIGKTARLHQALVVELAVLNLIEIEAKEEGKDFLLRRTSETSATSDQKSLLVALGLNKKGDELLLSTSLPTEQRMKLSKAFLELRAQASKTIAVAGYFKKRTLGAPAIGFGIAVVVFITWIVSALTLDAETEAGFALVPFIAFGPFTAIYWLLVSKRALSDKGVDLVSFIKGLGEYIELAEKDRLEFLQSPKGASLKASEIKGKQALKLYESVLPWAILLGLQKQWAQVLGELYQDQGNPIWFIGPNPFISSFPSLDAALGQSLAVSSTGGSDGGGSSGGGGGGGGGGGI